MRIFRTVTSPIWLVHGTRAMLATTPALRLVWSMSGASGGGWLNLFRKVVHASLRDADSLKYIGFGLDSAFLEETIASRVFEILCAFLFDRVQSAVLSVDSSTQSSIMALAADQKEATEALLSMKQDWDTLQWCESIATRSTVWAVVLAKVPWVNMQSPG